MTKQAVVGIVNTGNTVLIGKKRKDSTHSMSEEWHIPGGKVEPEETPQEALYREIYEETQVHIDNIQLLEKVNKQGFEIYWFVCSPKNTQVVAGDDLTEAQFVDKVQVAQLCGKQAQKLWPDSVRAFLKGE